MNRDELIAKIVLKKEFSDLPEKDVEKALEKFDKKQYLDEEKVKFTRDLLRKVFSGFASQKLLIKKDKDEGWFLKKHLSSRERYPYYKEIYSRILKNENKKLSIIDLGAGINGFSYKFFKEIGYDVNYVAIESIGQFVKSMNFYFKENKLNAKAFHLSLFDLDAVKKIISEQKRPRIAFIFKTIDSLEMMERDFSEKLLMELSEITDKIAVSFATRSMIKRTKFKVGRNWIIDFIKEHFNVAGEFELGDEKYLVFSKK